MEYKVMSFVYNPVEDGVDAKGKKRIVIEREYTEIAKNLTWQAAKDMRKLNRSLSIVPMR
jgi:hypothetical protein